MRAREERARRRAGARGDASPELVRLVLAEAGGEVHGHAVLLARSEEGVVLQRQRATASARLEKAARERKGSARCCRLEQLGDAFEIVIAHSPHICTALDAQPAEHIGRAI